MILRIPTLTIHNTIHNETQKMTFSIMIQIISIVTTMTIGKTTFNKTTFR